MPKIILGNGNNLLVSDDGSTGDTIIVGNGINDVVSAVGSSNDIINLGNGAGDTVNVGLPLGIGGSSDDTITLGNGDGDTVTAARSNFDTITLGNGVGDKVDAYLSSNDITTLGNGAGDMVDVGGGFDSLRHALSAPLSPSLKEVLGFNLSTCTIREISRAMASVPLPGVTSMYATPAFRSASFLTASRAAAVPW